MYVSLFPDPSRVSEEQLREDILSIPAWRASKALKYRRLIDRVLCVKAYVLLRDILRREYGLAGNPEFSYLECGKPVLKDFPDIHFNLSHCEKGILCVVDDNPVGCDIEVIPETVDKDILRYAFSPAEQDAILGASDSRVEFARQWTIKEAVLKFTGLGLVDDLPSLMTSGLLPQKISIETKTDVIQGFAFTIAKQ